MLRDAHTVHNQEESNVCAPASVPTELHCIPDTNVGPTAPVPGRSAGSHWLPFDPKWMGTGEMGGLGSNGSDGSWVLALMMVPEAKANFDVNFAPLPCTPAGTVDLVAESILSVAK